MAWPKPPCSSAAAAVARASALELDAQAFAANRAEPGQGSV
jgi:hypothetical protein